MKTSDVIILLKSLHDLDTLSLFRIMNDIVNLSPLLLPKIKSLRLNEPGNSFLELFAKVSTLEDFNFYHCWYVADIQELEDFILRQEKLKKLVIYNGHPNLQGAQIFSDLSLVKFRLESISFNHVSIDKDSAVQFFQQQQNLKNVFVANFYEPNRVKYVEILRSIWTLPKLDSFEYGNDGITDEDLIALSEIRNESVIHIMSWEGDEAQLDGQIFEIFPNIVRYEISADNWELNNVPSGKLKILKQRYLTESLIYQPPLVDFDQEKFESDVIEFFQQSNQIKSVDIGRNEWIQQVVRLSIEFWQKVLDVLQELTSIVIYDSGDIKELVQLLIDSKKSFNDVGIITNAVGLASVEEMEMPSWLQISEVE
jgi:hypothetical protein